MRGAGLLLGYFLIKVLVCNAEGEPGQKLDDYIMVSEYNDSKEEDNVSDSQHMEDRCRGYYDVMGQWDPPFVCRTGSYLFCCGTCGFRFCCAFKTSRLDQSNCKNYDTPPWMMTGKPEPKQVDVVLDTTKEDRTNLIVYIICGVVAIMALIGIFTKLGLEKAHRHRENMSRARGSVMRHPGPGEHTDDIGMHGQHYENIQARAAFNSLQGSQLNNACSGSAFIPHPYPAMGEITSPYDPQQPGKDLTDLNMYASLKAVAAKANDNFYINRRHVLEMTAKDSLPMQPVDTEPEPTNPYSPPLQHSQKHKRHRSKRTKGHGSRSAAYGSGSNPVAELGLLRNWEGKETMVLCQTYVPKRHGTMEKVSELHDALYMPPQAYFVTNSKTEVTV